MAQVGAIGRDYIGSTLETLRDVGACSLAGVIVGILVGGIGGRLAMRVSGIAAGQALQGVQTEAGFPVGTITASGTIGLIIFAGAIPGAVGGLFYAVVRPWLAGLGRWRGVAFGMVLLAVLGSVIVEPLNGDFGRFGPVALNVAMFGGLFVIFGVLLAPTAARLEAAGGRNAAVDVVLWLAALPPLLFLVLAVVQSVRQAGTPDPTLAAVPWFIGLFVIAVAQRWYLTRGGSRFDRPSDLPTPRATAVSYALLALPVLATAWLTISSIVWIFRLAI